MLCLAAAAFAKDGGTSPKIDLGITTFGEIPKGNQLSKKKADDSMEGPTVTASNAAYTVLKVAHAKSFARSPTGSVAMGALDALPLSGKPLSTEKFTTVIRIKSPQRAGASVELTIADPRGDTLMSSTGNFTYRGTRGDEIDYTVDWDPTPCRAGGDYVLMIRIGGQELGTWPMKFAEAVAKPPPAK